MTHQGLHPMREDGKWIRSSNGQHHFITNPDHQQRLLSEGGQIVDDPRRPPEATEREVHTLVGDIKVDIEEEKPPEKHEPHRRREGRH